MAKAQLTQYELNAALRRSGCASVAEVHAAILEKSRAISAVAVRTAGVYTKRDGVLAPSPV
jgi:uncharacterized membrane protein YcaP (DUF421 family)